MNLPKMGIELRPRAPFSQFQGPRTAVQVSAVLISKSYSSTLILLIRSLLPRIGHLIWRRNSLNFSDIVTIYSSKVGLMLKQELFNFPQIYVNIHLFCINLSARSNRVDKEISINKDNTII